MVYGAHLHKQVGAYSELEVARSAGNGVAAMMSAEEDLSADIENLAQRIESIAESLEQA